MNWNVLGPICAVFAPLIFIGIMFGPITWMPFIMNSLEKYIFFNYEKFDFEVYYNGDTGSHPFSVRVKLFNINYKLFSHFSESGKFDKDVFIDIDSAKEYIKTVSEHYYDLKSSHDKKGKCAGIFKIDMN